MGSKGLTHWTSETVYECSEIAGSPQCFTSIFILFSVHMPKFCWFTQLEERKCRGTTFFRRRSWKNFSISSRIASIHCIFFYCQYSSNPWAIYSAFILAQDSFSCMKEGVIIIMTMSKNELEASSTSIRVSNNVIISINNERKVFFIILKLGSLYIFLCSSVWK
jgi:hypothetical protein